MKLSDPQQQAIGSTGNLLLTACPGSGKTTCIVAKLLDCGEKVQNSLRKVACITYTNAAVYEIERRLQLYGQGNSDGTVEVSTIHTFCLSNILGRFYWRIPHYRKGFRVAAPDSDEFREAADAVGREYGLTKRAQEGFELLNRAADGSPISNSIPDDAIADFWQRLQSQDLIDFPNIVYESYNLLSDHPSIASGLAARFAWILVDEFQDTSELQVEILNKINDYHRTRFFLVGDPHQSIFAFAGARPALFDTFSRSISAQTNIKLLNNYRSSDLIVRQAEIIIPRSPAMVAAGANKTVAIQPEHVIETDASAGILGHFLPAIERHGISLAESAVVAPWWVPLFNVARTLRQHQVPIVGPGARPYNRHFTFGVLCEQICAYIAHREPRRIRYIARELTTLLSESAIDTSLKLQSYEGRIVIYRLITRGAELHQQMKLAVPWLERAATEFAKILIDAELLADSNKSILKDSVEQMKIAMVQRDVDLRTFTVDHLGLFASPEKNLKLLTLHSCKGREFDAVAIIDLHDNRLPHPSAHTAAEQAEARRLFYVGVTRARKLLMFITHKNGDPSRFLIELKRKLTN
jgi:DNA helicase II / ATP-dependent DNA helicase PcrA